MTKDTPFKLMCHHLGKHLGVDEESPSKIKTALMQTDRVGACEHFEELHTLQRKTCEWTTEALGLCVMIAAESGLPKKALDKLYLLVGQHDLTDPIPVEKTPKNKVWG